MLKPWMPLAKSMRGFANAGVGGQAKSFVEMTTAEWRRVMNVNLDGAFFTLRAAARHMCEHNVGGSFVATASLTALEGQASGQHYAATKGGLISMMRVTCSGIGTTWSSCQFNPTRMDRHRHDSRLAPPRHCQEIPTPTRADASLGRYSQLWTNRHLFSLGRQRLSYWRYFCN